MKKFLIFIIGVIVGVVLTILFSLLLSGSNDDNPIWFEEPGETINEQCFKVFQVLEDNAALVHSCNSSVVVYLLVNNEGKYYYDEEVVNVPRNKIARQIGIYKYPTNNLKVKTVPIVQILDK